jgi:hypothetical protein
MDVLPDRARLRHFLQKWTSLQEVSAESRRGDSNPGPLHYELRPGASETFY